MSSIITTFSVQRGAGGAMSVTCKKTDGNTSVSWAVKCFSTNIADATKEADLYADKALEAVKQGSRLRVA